MAFPQSKLPGETPLRAAAPLLIYLDLNKWVDLAHAETGGTKGKQFEAALDIANALAADGRAIFPLSSLHLMEVAKIGSDARRGVLAGLMVRLSQGWFIASASALIGKELRRAIACQFGKPITIAERSALTKNLKTALADPKLIDAAGGFDEQIFRNPAVLAAFIATARVGPEFIRNWRGFAEQHETGRALRWDTSRDVRKRAYCAQLTFGLQDRLGEAFSEFELDLSALETLGAEGCVSFLESVPVLDVEITLHVERNEHRDRKIDPNDEIDIGFLSIAVPYCHGVVTEKFWASLVTRHNLDRKYDTLVGSDVSDVLQTVDAMTRPSG